MPEANGDVITKPRRIKNGADLWDSYNDIDEALNDNHVDIKRVQTRVQNNRQRLDFLKLAVRAGVLKQETLALPDATPTPTT